MREIIAEFLGVEPSQVTFFWKGRVALYAILKAIGIESGDEIILPGYTCIVVVNPIMYLGAIPVYVEINPLTYTIDVSAIESKITPRTKAILAQNTYGLAPDLDAIFEIARKYNLSVIEDCAHGFGGYYKGKPNGTVADVSFFSTQWNKPFSTGIGGFAVSRNPLIARKLREMEINYTRPSFKDEITLKVLLFIRDNLSTNLYWPAIKIYRWLSKNNLILGSSQREELGFPQMPDGFEKGISKTQIRRGERELSNFTAILQHRRKVAQNYIDILKSMNIEPPFEPEYAIHTFLKFPLLVKDRPAFFHQAEKMKIELGDWFLSPIHPILDNLEIFNYQWGACPIAEKIARHIVNLPTHAEINQNYINRIEHFLIKNKANLFHSYQEILS